MKFFKTLVALVGVTMVLGALAGVASAGRLSFSSQTVRAGFARLNISGGFGTTECAVTMEGSLHGRTLAKTANSLIGYINRAILGGCPRGTAALLSPSLPWHLKYSSFNGSLPNISKINLTVTGVQLEVREPVFGVTCLLSGGVLTLGIARDHTAVAGFTDVGGQSPTNCGINATVSGTSNTLTVQGAATRITVTLI